MDIYFIAHGSAQIGMGHIMRSMALAAEFKENGYHVVFFSKYPQGLQTLEKNGFEIIEMPSRSSECQGFCYGDNDELISDVVFIQRALLNTKACILVVDSYNVSKEFFLALKKLTSCLVYIDDLNRFLYHVDVLINGTAAAGMMAYQKENNDKCLLLGLTYNMLRKEFRGLARRKVQKGVSNILLTTGAADPYHMTEKFLEFLSSESWFSKVNFSVVVGTGFSRDIFSSDIVKGSGNIIIYENPEKMSDIMLQSDLAVTAGGSTIYELAACGVPMLVFRYADNQQPQISALEKQKLIINLGDFRQIEKGMFLKKIKKFMEDYAARKDFVKRGQQIVNGKGTQEIVRKIEE